MSATQQVNNLQARIKAHTEAKTRVVYSASRHVIKHQTTNHLVLILVKNTDCIYCSGRRVINPYKFSGIVGGYGLRRMRSYCVRASCVFLYGHLAKAVEMLCGDSTKIVQRRPSCRAGAVTVRGPYDFLRAYEYRTSFKAQMII